MKSALVIAVLCVVSSFQLANANIADIKLPLPEFQSPEIQGIATNFMQGVRKLKTCLMQHMSMINTNALKQSFFSYDFLASAVSNAKPECVTEDMKTLSSSAITTLSACFPDQATINSRMQEGQQRIAAVLDKLKAVDQQLLTVTDAVERSDLIARVDIENAGAFFTQILNNIVEAAEPARKCIETAAIGLRSTALEDIKKMENCYSAK